MTLSTAEARRAQSWNTIIASVILGSDVPYQDIGHDRHWSGLGGFSVDRRDGAWFCFGTGEGDHSTVAMVQFLQKGSARTAAEAWVLSFITAHPGDGPCAGEVADDDASETRARISAFRARKALADSEPFDGTAGEQYLISRGLEPPYPLPLRWLPDARAGEGAIVTELVASNRAVAVLLTYVDALATKSLHRPARQRFNLEPHRPDAVMAIEPATTGAVDIACDVVATEGLENLLSLAVMRQPAWRLVGLPGIGALKHLSPARKGERWIVFQDSDPEDTPAVQGLQAGVDALLLAGAVVRVTARAAGDANALLRDGKQGLRALRRLLAKPAGAALSFDGEVTRLAGLPETEYEKARKAAAAAHGVRVSHIDREVTAVRERLHPRAESPSEDLDDPPWPGDVDLAQALDSAVQAVPRFLAAPSWYLDVIALWSAATYLVHSEKLAIPIMPQLAFQSLGSSEGKSTALEIVATLAYRGRLRSSYTASTIFRKIHAGQVTFCLVDLHNKLGSSNLELQQIIQACHRRAEAFVDRTVILASGEPEVRTYKCWAPLAWGSIGPMRPEVQNRAIVLPMRRALPAESEQLDKSSPGRCGALIDVRRHLYTWGPTITALPKPTMPAELHNREADNWRVLFAVAQLAGADWPERAGTAARECRALERRPPLLVRLLSDIRTIFENAADNRITTSNLISRLLDDDEAGWDEANRGRPINAWWLRERFTGLLEPASSQQWQENDSKAPGGRQHCRGYLCAQFADAFLRYLPPSVPDSTGTSVPSAVEAPTAADSKASPVPDDEPDVPSHQGLHPVPAAASKSAGSEAAGPEEPIVPDEKQTERVRDADPVSTVPAPALTRKRKRKPPNGEDTPGLDLPPAPIPKYQPGALDNEIRRLHRENPSRSQAWLAKKTGQPHSVIRSILEPDGAGDAS